MTSIADFGVQSVVTTSTMPAPRAIAGSGPYEGRVISNIAPYQEHPNRTDAAAGVRPQPVNEYAPNYVPFDGVGVQRVAGLWRSWFSGIRESAQNPGLVGLGGEIGAGNGTVYYDVASPQLYLRPAPLPSPQVMGLFPVYG